MGEEVGGDVKREEKLPPLDPSSALETPLPRAPKERAGGTDCPLSAKHQDGCRF